MPLPNEGALESLAQSLAALLTPAWIAVDTKRLIKKKTHNNIESGVRCAFEHGYRDHPEKRNPASALKCVRLVKKDRTQDRDEGDQ